MELLVKVNEWINNLKSIYYVIKVNEWLNNFKKNVLCANNMCKL